MCLILHVQTQGLREATQKCIEGSPYSLCTCTAQPAIYWLLVLVLSLLPDIDAIRNVSWREFTNMPVTGSSHVSTTGDFSKHLKSQRSSAHFKESMWKEFPYPSSPFLPPKVPETKTRIIPKCIFHGSEQNYASQRQNCVPRGRRCVWPSRVARGVMAV